MPTALGAVEEISQALLADLESLTDDVLAHIDGVDSGYEAAHVDLDDAGRRSVKANLRLSLLTLAGEAAQPAAAPAEALAEAVTCAAAGVPLDALLHTYRLGHAAALETLLARTEDLDLSTHVRAQAIRAVTRASFAYVDSVTPLVANAYHAERERLVRSSVRRRREAVLAVLDGAEPDEPAIGRSLRGRHTCIAVAGAHGAELIATVLPDALIVAVSTSLSWAWSPSPVSLDPPDGHHAGIGEPGRDADGFRRSHRQAVAALEVAMLLARPSARYDDVALEALALADRRAAREFAVEQLGPLAADDKRAIRLRTTLDAYLRARCNAAAAAAELGISDRTVAYRVGSIEQLLGRPVAPRATELSLALRWRTLLEAHPR